MPDSELRSASFFEDTQWSSVLSAKGGNQDALGRLLSRYRRPILNEIRVRHRISPEDAEDFAQDFIVHWLKHDLLYHVAAEHGRFRAYLKKCISNFLADRYDAARAAKRGGGKPTVSLDEDDEAGKLLARSATVTPEPGLAFDVEWAFTVLDCALERLRAECASEGRGSLFDALAGHFGDLPEAVPSAEVAQRLGLTANATKVALHRLRRRLGKLIRDEVRQTVASEEDWQSELRYLLELLAQHPRGSL